MSSFVEAHDYGWASLRFTTGDAELIFVPQIGGRLMGIRLAGRELLFVNPELAGATPQTATFPDSFPLWGGEKTWVAPQSHWPAAVPFPLLDSGAYTAHKQDGRLVLTSAVCPSSGLQIVREILPESGGMWSTRHRLRNRGSQHMFAGPWMVMMINRNVRFFVPGAGQPVFMLDAPGDVGASGTLTRIDCCDATRFKTGHNLTEGWFAAFMPLPDGRSAMIVQFAPLEPQGGRWAHGHPAEIFNSDLYPYCEMELHGPARDLAPGDEIIWDMRTAVALLDHMPETEPAVRDAIGKVMARGT